MVLASSGNMKNFEHMMKVLRIGNIYNKVLYNDNFEDAAEENTVPKKATIITNASDTDFKRKVLTNMLLPFSPFWDKTGVAY